MRIKQENMKNALYLDMNLDILLPPYSLQMNPQNMEQKGQCIDRMLDANNS